MDHEIIYRMTMSENRTFGSLVTVRKTAGNRYDRKVTLYQWPLHAMANMNTLLCDWYSGMYLHMHEGLLPLQKPFPFNDWHLRMTSPPVKLYFSRHE